MARSVLSYGGGVNTFAILLRWPERYDYCLFSDTGDEMPQTYEHIEEVVKPFCKENRIEFVTTKHWRWDSLLQHCMKKNMIPLMSKRWCTTDHKIVPIKKWVRSLGNVFRDPIIMGVGIAYDEAHRARYDSMARYIKVEYPLIDHKITRQGCLDIITESGYPAPIKSGCYYCPFQSRSKIRELSIEYPDLFEKAVQMEKNANTSTPLMHGRPLTSIRDSGLITDFMDFGETDDENYCTSGHCMT